MDTEVAIVGAGPAGLLLARLLHLDGVESVVLEARDREYVEQRVRAGVLEQGTMDTLREAGVGERMDRQGAVHEGIELRYHGQGHRIDFAELTGRAIMVYGQQEVVKDLIERRQADGLPLLFEVADVEVDPGAPAVAFTHGGDRHELR
ncbi:MAG: FAD-dependent monooxygenase, partial [Thermoleophilia bacterium]